jgi:hypothetical protein
MNRFEWDPEEDSFIYHEPSELDLILEENKDIFTIISHLNHIPVEKLKDEMVRRGLILKWMAKNEFNSYEDVRRTVRNYYINPEKVYNEARLGSA